VLSWLGSSIAARSSSSRPMPPGLEPGTGCHARAPAALCVVVPSLSAFILPESAATEAQVLPSKAISQALARRMQGTRVWTCATRGHNRGLPPNLMLAPGMHGWCMSSACSKSSVLNSECRPVS